MKFFVKEWSKGRARTGILQLPGCPNSIETPCLLLSTRKGLPHFLSPDLLSSLPSADSHLLQVSPLHFFVWEFRGSQRGAVKNGKGKEERRLWAHKLTLENRLHHMEATHFMWDVNTILEGLSTKTISNIGGLHQIVGLHEYGFAAVPRDSIICLPDSGATNKMGASFETPGGRFLITPVEYMKMNNSLRPNWWVSLPDEVPVWVTQKRNKASVDRTVRWLDECILSSQTDGAAFGAIVGGCDVEGRKCCAVEVVKRNVSGYWIGGFGLGEHIDERPALLNTITDILPEEKPRQTCGLGLPEEILQGVAAGIDIFDSTYTYNLTLGGFALTFPVDNTEVHVSDYQLIDIGSDLTKINLRAVVYRRDATPIVDGCGCYTCQNHTKAYINHLLNVHEMLAQILLEVHNTHHYLGFFCSIREAIKKGKFEEFHRKFIERRHNHHVEAAEIA